MRVWKIVTQANNRDYVFTVKEGDYLAVDGFCFMVDGIVAVERYKEAIQGMSGNPTYIYIGRGRLRYEY